jgi:hypothetical protein
MPWPYNENDFMEIGDTGWVPVGEGKYKNIYTGHMIDENGNEYDSNGDLISEGEHGPEDGDYK